MVSIKNTRVIRTSSLTVDDIFKWNNAWGVEKFQVSTNTIYLLGADTSMWSNSELPQASNDFDVEAIRKILHRKTPTPSKQPFTKEAIKQLFEKFNVDPNDLYFKVTHKGRTNLTWIDPVTSSSQCYENGDLVPALNGLRLAFRESILTPPPSPQTSRIRAAQSGIALVAV